MLKYRTSAQAMLAPLVVVLMLVMSSCTKESPVCPASRTDDAAGTVKNMSIAPEDKATEERRTTRSSDTGKPQGDGEGDDDGISDDGDDLSDTERNRKKR
jgi:hypothetical protein